MTEKNNSLVAAISTNQYLIGTIPCDYCGDTIQWCAPVQCECCKSSYYCGDICRHLDESRNSHSTTTCRNSSKSSSSSSSSDSYDQDQDRPVRRRALHQQEEEEEEESVVSSTTSFPTCCGICRDTVSYKVIVPGCGHEFCYSCLLSYQNHAKTDACCPMCRGSLPQDVAEFYTDRMYSTFCCTGTTNTTDYSRSVVTNSNGNGNSGVLYQDKTKEESTLQRLSTLIDLEDEMYRNRKNEPLCYQGRSWRRFQRAVLCCKSELFYNLGRYDKALSTLYHCHQIKNGHDCPLLCCDKYCFLEVSLVARCRLRLQDYEGCAQALEALKGSSPWGISNTHLAPFDTESMGSSSMSSMTATAGITSRGGAPCFSWGVTNNNMYAHQQQASCSKSFANTQLLAKHAQCLYECAMTISDGENNHREVDGNHHRRNALLERTVAACHAVTRLDRHYPNMYTWMAFAYEELNQPIRAIQSMRNALAYDRPDEPQQVYLNLQRLKKLLGEDFDMNDDDTPKNNDLENQHEKLQSPTPPGWVILLLPWLQQNQSSDNNDKNNIGKQKKHNNTAPLSPSNTKHGGGSCRQQHRSPSMESLSKDHQSKDADFLVSSAAEESLLKEFSLPSTDKFAADDDTTATITSSKDKLYGFSRYVIVAE